MRKKTILHIIDTTGSGGAETIFLNLVESFSNERYEPVVIINGTGWLYDKLILLGIEPYVYSSKGSFNISYLLFILKIINKHCIDIIQSHLMGASVYGAMAALISRRSMVATFHGYVDVDENERMKKLKFMLIAMGANSIVMVSKHLKRYFNNSNDLNSNKIKVIYNGVERIKDIKSHDLRLRDMPEIDNDDILIGAVGNIRKPKRYDLLLESAAILQKKSNKYKFVIVGQGDGVIMDELYRMRTKLGLDKTVYFIGFYERAKQILKQLDIYLLCSNSEGFSISTVEAMAAERPVIATRCGGPEEIISHGIDGLLIEPENAEAIADAISRLASDEYLSSKISKNALKTANSKFSIETMIGAYEDIYRTL